MFAYVGSRTTKERNAQGEGITVYGVENGNWRKIQTVSCGDNPSYLCLNKAQDHLYAIHGDGSTVTAFAVDPAGMLQKLNTVSTYGTNPVHLVVSPNGKNLYVANLETGSLAVLAIKSDGTLGDGKQVLFIPGKPAHGYISHPHQVCLHPDGKWLLVPCQGRDHGVGKVVVYAIDPIDDHLEETFVWVARPGAEPRHIAVHPNGKWVYLVNEKDSTVIYFQFDQKTGALQPVQLLSTLPDDYFGPGWASGIVMDPKGQFVIASNRTHDSLTRYKIAPDTGRLHYLQTISSGGVQPRFLDRDPEGAIVAANELSHNITFFTSKSDGLLHQDALTVETGSPVCVIWKV